MLMNHHKFRTPGMIFTGICRYKPSYGAVGVLLCAGGCILIARVLLLFFQDGDTPPEAIRVAQALFFGGGLLLYIGITLLFSMLTGYTKRLVVSEEQRERLMRQIKERVLPRFENLRIGDDAHSVMETRELPSAPTPGSVRTP